MLQDEACDEGHEDLVPDLQKIYDAGKNLLRQVDEILDLPKIESCRTELQIDSIAVTDLIKTVEASVRPIIEKAGDTLTIYGLDAVGSIKGDRNRIQLVLSALIDRACRATKRSDVLFQARWATVDNIDWVSFSVKDSGAGIDGKLLQNLFKDYKQADSSIFSFYGGTALGLVICHRFSLVMG